MKQAPKIFWSPLTSTNCGTLNTTFTSFSLISILFIKAFIILRFVCQSASFNFSFTLAANPSIQAIKLCISFVADLYSKVALFVALYKQDIILFFILGSKYPVF